MNYNPMINYSTIIADTNSKRLGGNMRLRGNMQVITEYDENNNLIHYRDTDGYEWWSEYDENNNEIHTQNSNGYEVWREYDKNNNMIHYRDSEGYEYWREYDENNNEIHFRTSTGHVVDTTIVQFPKIVWPNEI